MLVRIAQNCTVRENFIQIKNNRYSEDTKTPLVYTKCVT